ncbi:MAG: hypothetical protein AMXMBFR64_27760 [Myxococcales bacterium]
MKTSGRDRIRELCMPSLGFALAAVMLLPSAAIAAGADEGCRAEGSCDDPGAVVVEEDGALPDDGGDARVPGGDVEAAMSDEVVPEPEPEAATTPRCPLGAEEVTIAESDACVERGDGWWVVPGHGGEALLAYAGPPDSVVTFRLVAEGEGKRAFWLHVPDRDHLSPKAPATVIVDGQRHERFVDLLAMRGGWASLGAYPVHAGADVRVEVRDDTGEAFTGAADSPAVTIDDLRVTLLEPVSVCTGCEPPELLGWPDPPTPDAAAQGCMAASPQSGAVAAVALLLAWTRRRRA